MKSVSKMFCFAATVGMGLWAVASTSHAAISGPYTADANTLHLWHINEAAVPVADDPLVGTPIDLTSLGSVAGGLLSAPSYAGFGTAYSGVNVTGTGLFAKAPVSGASDDTSTATFWNQTTGAFTYEVIIRVDFDATVETDFVGLITMDQDSGTRPFTWYLNPVDVNADTVQDGMQMFFSNGAATDIVASGPGVLSITQGHWYHAAVTYDGNEGGVENMKMYWTDMGTDLLPDTSATTANLAFTDTLDADLVGTTGDLALGAEARGTGANNTANWLGLIDEARISDIARGADQFIFVPEPSAIITLMIGMTAIGVRGLRRRK